MAIWMSEMPASSANSASCSVASSLRWLVGSDRSKRSGSRAARVEPGSSDPLRQRPDSQPPASGL
jgi:hypothetical protein